MEDKTNTVEVNIIDVLSGSYVVPHHRGLGIPSEFQADNPVEVRMIDIPVVLKVDNHKLKFNPGEPRANMEYIQYTATLVADALSPVVWHKLVAGAHIRTRKVKLSELLVMISSDNLPDEWFLSYRDNMILRDDLQVELDKGVEKIKAGSTWHQLVHTATLLQRQQDLSSDTHIRREIKKSRSISDEFTSIPAAKRSRRDDHNTEDIREIDVSYEQISDMLSFLTNNK